MVGAGQPCLSQYCAGATRWCPQILCFTRLCLFPRRLLSIVRRGPVDAADRLSNLRVCERGPAPDAEKMGSWRNWQTRMLEGHVPARACWFDSSRAHFSQRRYAAPRLPTALIHPWIGPTESPAYAAIQGFRPKVPRMRGFWGGAAKLLACSSRLAGKASEESEESRRIFPDFFPAEARIWLCCEKPGLPFRWPSSGLVSNVSGSS